MSLSESESSIAFSDDDKTEPIGDTTFSDNQMRDEVKEIENMVKQETRQVETLRFIVMLMLLGTAAATAAFTFILLNDEQNEDFVTSVDLLALTIENGAQFHMKSIKAATTVLSEAASAHAASSGSEWPFVTIPDFEVKANELRSSASIEAFLFLPLVAPDDVPAWGNYSSQNSKWLADSYKVQKRDSPVDIIPFLWDVNPAAFGGGGPLAKRSNASAYDILTPLWQSSPPPLNSSVINWNFMEISWVGQVLENTRATRGSSLGPPGDPGPWLERIISQEDHDRFHAESGSQDYYKDGNEDTKVESSSLHPHSVMINPIFRDLGDPDSELVGLLFTILPWDKYLQNLLPDGVKNILVVLRSTCGDVMKAMTYELDGKVARYIGNGDMHDSKYHIYEKNIDLTPILLNGRNESMGVNDCLYSFSVYPTAGREAVFDTGTPKRFTIIVSATFFAMALTFFVYDQFVKRKNRKIVATAAKSNKIVASLFPSNVRDRLLDTRSGRKVVSNPTKKELNGFLAGTEQGCLTGVDDIVYKDKPIADLFTDTTILFADICGFTAWSSVREPSQVFTLLETLYAAFDEIARTRRVYKVETIGDCYVAVVGLPEPRRDHAVVMARFARDCMAKMHHLVKRLEPLLGPDTSDLSMRVGMHSGSVTAGVLRGERSRFQLFGDTMNTAARMEHTGMPGRIQISQDTVDILIAAGKGQWVVKRDETVVAKGKGEMQTYWLIMGETGSSSVVSGSVDGSSSGLQPVTALSPEAVEQKERAVTKRNKVSLLVEWNCQVLHRLLQKIVARRGTAKLVPLGPEEERSIIDSNSDDRTVLDEVSEIIVLPRFDAGSAKQSMDPDEVNLGRKVESQLKELVESIANGYRDNSFHSFDHASHVTMSVVKLLGRIVAPVLDLDEEDAVESTLHDHTFGIVSDPITQFACVFSALIHDVDHSGVSNAQLVAEGDPYALQYKSKSVAEQRSVDFAWGLLMNPKYVDLRAAIYATKAELKRFRQLVVNSVMATDVMDKDLKKLRNARWECAFNTDFAKESISNTNRKATIVIEHLIQASDVAHTMQHWHVYRKWNEKLFKEMSMAYRNGRAHVDPADRWYEGELGFFDFYIIPLAKKLKDCGVFGVSSDEYLTYAEKNRQEWEERGREIVAEMVEAFQQM